MGTFRVRGDGCPPPAPPGRADVSRRALDLHSFEFTTDLGRDQRESGPSLFNQGLVDRNPGLGRRRACGWGAQAQEGRILGAAPSLRAGAEA